MPEFKAGSRKDIARKTVLFAADHVDWGEEHPVKQVRGIPVLYRYVSLGKDWVVFIFAEGHEVKFQAAHRTETKMTYEHDNLQALLDAIEEEFGAVYLPDIEAVTPPKLKEDTLPKGYKTVEEEEAAEPLDNPDAKWAAEDERIASLDLHEDVSRWPVSDIGNRESNAGHNAATVALEQANLGTWGIETED